MFYVLLYRNRTKHPSGILGPFDSEHNANIAGGAKLLYNEAKSFKVILTEKTRRELERKYDICKHGTLSLCPECSDVA